jgi:hypothetical protein
VCWDPGAGCLYAGGENGQLYRVDLAAGAAQTVARAPGQVLGVAVDGAGGNARVVAQDPQGTLLGAPTNVAFAGAQLDVAVVANLGRWHLTVLELGVRGVPLHRPAHWGADADPATGTGGIGAGA